VRAGEGEAEESVRMPPDCTSRRTPVALPAELRACAGRVRALAVL